MTDGVDMSELLLNQDIRKQAIKNKFSMQYKEELREDEQFKTTDDVKAATQTY